GGRGSFRPVGLFADTTRSVLKPPPAFSGFAPIDNLFGRHVFPHSSADDPAEDRETDNRQPHQNLLVRTAGAALLQREIWGNVPAHHESSGDANDRAGGGRTDFCGPSNFDDVASCG